MLEDSGVAPFEQVAAKKKVAQGLFSEPAAAEVLAPTQQALIRTNARPNKVVYRSDANNQRLYQVSGDMQPVPCSKNLASKHQENGTIQ